MDSTLMRPSRLVGALAALGIGLVLLALSAASVLPTRGASGALVVLAIAATVVGVPVGWALAPMAARRGTRGVLGSAFLVTIVAVPAGSLLVAGAMVAGGASLASPAEALAGIVVLAFVGLVLFGLPIGAATFAIAGVWVALLCTLVERRSREPSSVRTATGGAPGEGRAARPRAR